MMNPSQTLTLAEGAMYESAFGDASARSMQQAMMEAGMGGGMAPVPPVGGPMTPPVGAPMTPPAVAPPPVAPPPMAPMPPVAPPPAVGAPAAPVGVSSAYKMAGTTLAAMAVMMHLCYP